jgi:hypothetical protein
MDPGRNEAVDSGSAGTAASLPAPQLLQLLQLNFNGSYNGNRSPFGIYVHTPWANNQSIAATNDFLEWALALRGTYVVTMRQVIEWMQVRRGRGGTLRVGAGGCSQGRLDFRGGSRLGADGALLPCSLRGCAAAPRTRPCCPPPPTHRTLCLSARWTTG